jgi:hypothetical protein
VDNYKIRKNSNSRLEIYDPVRKRYVALTPEEKIRQHTINFLHKFLKYPYGNMGVECGLKINEVFFRTDIVIRNRRSELVMIVECKQEDVSLSRNVEEQILKYFQGCPTARFLLLSNGQDIRCFSVVNGDSFVLVDKIPSWEDLQ